MALDINSVPGFQGFGAIGRKVLADTEGFFGWSAAKTTNVLVHLVPPPFSTTVRAPLTLTLTYGGQSHSVDYNPDFTMERQLPEDTTIVLTTESPWYLPVSQSFRIPAGTVQQVTVQLAFDQAYALVTRKRFI